ncbi:unnamed protein product [Haemonchus placei]|uniref:Uncharacterized protein n=1 Tax=Haemonchus placei TaxID=6290 RepID=A0A3P7VPQ0_HAEPC|nr:unnamed protein product [Haemonchus placei]
MVTPLFLRYRRRFQRNEIFSESHQPWFFASYLQIEC